ncbi:hypothetical protein QAD02_001957 [Eretmocerus hayati]|uniref:Uncharacterized protein n=1 Tax=Eretmocerus hayati TaxID=131215 RepID=A0ACC2NIR9_9HYME|nr:hypothetical protein QAD02_001957 [Eretmocerus hayati]
MGKSKKKTRKPRYVPPGGQHQNIVTPVKKPSYQGIYTPDTPEVVAERRKKFAARPKAFSPLQTITRTKYRGLYINHKQPVDALPSSDVVLERLQVPHRVPKHDRIVSLTDAEEVYEAIIEANADGKVNPIYARNEPLLPDDVNPFEGVLPGYIAHNGPQDLHRDNNKTLGTLHPSVYYAERKVALPKFWLMIAKEDFHKLNEILAKISNELCEAGENFHEIGVNCSAPSNHKCFLITPTFCKDHGIRYEVVCQRDGDMVVVDQYVIHGVVNLEENESISMNFGSKRWSDSGWKFFDCGCKKSGISFLPPVSEKDHACPERGCSSIFFTQSELRRHMELLHGDTPVQRLFVCHRCYGHYVTEAFLNKHAETCGSKKRTTTKKLCLRCNQSFLDLPAHLKKCQKSCPHCGKPQSARGYDPHVTRCPSRPNNPPVGSSVNIPTQDKSVQTDGRLGGHCLQLSQSLPQGPLVLSGLCFACGVINDHASGCPDGPQLL